MNSMSKLPAMVGIGHDAPPARAWTLLLVASVAVSVYGNTAHALLTGHGWAAAAWFAVAPVALFWVTHLVAKTAGRSPHGAVKWLIWLGGIPAALAVAGMAFVVSFRALRDWTLHQGGDELSSILLPLIVDVIIALSSMMVLAMRPAAVTVPVEPPIQELVVQDASLPEPRTAVHPAELADQVADQPSDPIPAAVVQPDPQPVHETVDQVVNHPVNWDDADTEPLAAQAADQHPEPEVDRDPQPVPEPVNHRTLSLVDQPAVRDVDHRSIAEQVVARTASDWTVDQLELVSRSTPGPGRRVLADELGVSASTVSRMRKAIEQVTAETETATTAGASA